MILLITSLFIFLFVYLFSRHAVNDKPNMLAGYRSKRSMQSEAHWNFAQSYANRLMLRTTLVLIIIGVLLSIIEILYGHHLWTDFGGIALLLLGIVYLVIKTEHALKYFQL